MTVNTDDEFVGFADNLDDVIPDNLVDNTYLCELVDASLVTGKENRRYLIIKWEVVEDGDFFGEEIGPEIYWMFSKTEYEKAQPEEKKKMRKARRNRIQRLESLGIARDKLAEVTEDDLKGIQAHLSIQVRPKADSNKMMVWINNVELASNVGDTLDI